MSSRLQDAIELLDLRGWLEQYTETKTASNEEFRVQDCPECGEAKWKLYINDSKKLWDCKHCGWGRGINDVCVLMAKVSGIHINSVKLELIQTTVPATRDDLYLTQLANRIKGKELEVENPLEIEDLPGDQKFEGVYGSKVWEYTLHRGLTKELVEKYQLRSAIKLRNKFGPWLVFPILYNDIPVAYQGRRCIGDAEPKYLSSDTIGQWLWPAQNVTDSLVLCEGVFDVLGFESVNIQSSCTFGNRIKRQQISLLKQNKVKKIYLAYDSDAWREMLKSIQAYRHQFHIYVVNIESKSGKIDPGMVLQGKEPKSVLIGALNSAISIEDPKFFQLMVEKEFK